MVFVMKRGDVVYDRADRRHLGLIQCVCINHETATVRWLKSGWLSCRVPWGDLRLAPVDHFDNEVQVLKRKLYGEGK